MLKFLRSLLMTAFALAAAPSVFAVPVLQIEAGRLMGANNVTVNGANYNVAFVDGSCSSVFNGCDNAAFVFRSQDDAVAASIALLQGVFIDTAEGAFGSDPALTNGCGDSRLCEVFTPFPRTPEGFLSFAVAQNHDNAASMADGVSVLITNRPFGDTTDIPSYAYAVWSAADASQVPEPSSLLLMCAGLALLARRSRHKRGSAAQLS